MKKPILISSVMHIVVLLFFVGVNFIYPKKIEVPPRVVLDVAIITDKGVKAKKSNVKQQKKQKRKIVKKAVKHRKIVKKKIVKKNISRKPKIKLNAQKKIKSSTIKQNKNKTISKKVLKDLKPKKTIVSDSNVKKNTFINKKEIKIINQVKHSPNKSKNTQNLSQKITKDDLLALRNQIKQCWKVPAGISNASNLVTKVKVELIPTGKVINAEIYQTSVSLSNHFMQAMSESALRAILSDSCNPLKLPKNKYKQWKNIIITFDPKQMLN